MASSILKVGLQRAPAWVGSWRLTRIAPAMAVSSMPNRAKQARTSKTMMPHDLDKRVALKSSPPFVKQSHGGMKSIQANGGKIVSSDYRLRRCFASAPEVPWFPRQKSDLQQFRKETLQAGVDLEADHPGFHDADYRRRRNEIAQAALDYGHGDAVPRIGYTENETKTWGIIYDKLMPLIQKHACKEYLEIIPHLQSECSFSRDIIPQGQDISEFLKSKTGFTIQPVPGLVPAREFLNALAFRVFFSTQYMRHHSSPLYTPEPDLVHELIGHAPMFANEDFAAFSQEMGLASIGASDDQIVQLSRCYWYTVEFGLCAENGSRKAYGAGLLSSFGELEYSMSDEPELRPWDPQHAAKHDYPITTYQPVYYVAESFQDAVEKMRSFSKTLVRPFNVKFDKCTEVIETDNNSSALPNGE